MNKNNILQLYKSPKTVFTFKEIALILGESNKFNLASKIGYYVKKGDLKRLRRGVYVKNNYDKFELANKIYTPSYISFETVLGIHGIIFQYYEVIFVASYLSRDIELMNKQKISYKKLKNTILLNTKGIIKRDNYFIASRERAFMDMIYLNGDYYFDNLEKIDFEKCEGLLDIYDNKKMLKKLNSYKCLIGKNIK